jgi:hypothetical protein
MNLAIPPVQRPGPRLKETAETTPDAIATLSARLAQARLNKVKSSARHLRQLAWVLSALFFFWLTTGSCGIATQMRQSGSSKHHTALPIELPGGEANSYWWLLVGDALENYLLFVLLLLAIAYFRTFRKFHLGGLREVLRHLRRVGLMSLPLVLFLTGLRVLSNWDQLTQAWQEVVGLADSLAGSWQMPGVISLVVFLNLCPFLLLLVYTSKALEECHGLCHGLSASLGQQLEVAPVPLVARKLYLYPVPICLLWTTVFYRCELFPHYFR